MKIKLKIFLLFVIFQNILYSQIYINEVCPKNSNVLMDEDGDYPDWIELYNSSNFAVNIYKFGLSDSLGNIAKWQFPNITMPAKSYLTVFASGKNRKIFIDHWETIVDAYSQWKYFIPTFPIPNWNSVNFNDFFWPQGIGGFGYGDGDDNTVIPPPLLTIYLRKSFNIVDTSAIVAAVLHIDYDDGFVAYLNGIEIARANLGVQGNPTPFNEKAYQEHEAKLYQGNVPEKYFINRQVLKSIIKNGNNVLAIEVHNVDSTSSDLSAIPFLSFAINNNSFNYSATPSWFNINTASLHTNFKLSQNGETIYLSDSTSSLIDMFTYYYIGKDNSMGHQPDGTGNIELFATPTPNASNNSSAVYYGYVPDPVFSIQGGFYSAPQTLTLSDSLSNVTIYYTTNGSIPDSNSNLYSTAINIDSTTVIKAIAYDNSNKLLPSNVITNTYFINDSTSPTLPVISISTNPENLWDWNEGIYVKGPFADTLVPFFGANFWQDWEKNATVEFFDKKRTLAFRQELGLKIAGNYSRSNPQKSFKLIARGKYGEDRINYKIFPDKDIYSFKQIVLRDAGNDWNVSHFRDALMHYISKDNTNLDIQAYQPCVVYLNGEYWGVYNLREKINEYYIEDNHGVNSANVDLLQYNGAVMSGTNHNFIQLFNYITSNNMADSSNFAVVENWLDLDNFIDYFVVETYSNNWDWLVNNVRYWRDNKNNSKWRHILWDLDLGLNATWPFNANGLDSNLNKNYSAQSIMMSSLLNNINFKHRFINRYADLLNTLFVPKKMNDIITSFVGTLDPEMPRHFAKWGYGFNNPDWGTPGRGSYNEWKTFNISRIRIFVNNRPYFARNQIQNEFNLKKQVPVTLNVYPAKAGKILINTVIPDSLPWAGIYFDSVPITITAIPNPGYKFAFWQSNIFFPSPDTNISLTFNPDTQDVFTAYFMGAPDTFRICVSEINYNSSNNWDAGDWIELYNYGNLDVDISKWTFKDKYGYHKYTFPDNTILRKGEYLVLCQDTAKFKLLYPNITNVLGPFVFGLSSFDEQLRLYDKYGKEYLSITYTSALPWPQEANGKGYTLELVDPWGDYNNPYNWFTGCLGGSPGKMFTPCNTSIDESPSSELKAMIFPNPFLDKINILIELNDEKKYFNFSVFNIYGKLLLNKMNLQALKGKNIFTLNLSALSQSIYILQISDNNGILKNIIINKQ